MSQITLNINNINNDYTVIDNYPITTKGILKLLLLKLQIDNKGYFSKDLK